MMRNEYMVIVYIYIFQKIKIGKKSKPYNKSCSECKTVYVLNFYMWLKFLKLQSNYFAVINDYEGKIISFKDFP